VEVVRGLAGFARIHYNRPGFLEFFLLAGVTGMFDGLSVNLSNLHRLSSAQTRSLSAENTTGEKGKGGMAVPAPDKGPARDLGQGWKVAPSVGIAPRQTYTFADITGPGAIQQIWVTPAGTAWRNVILRIYWDDQEQPSVECPIGDFFCAGWGKYAQVSSLPVCVNPGSAFNCYWTMPFRKRCRMTVTNLADAETLTLYYQVNYVLAAVPDDAAYFHAQFRRSNPVPYKQVHTVLDGVQGQGQYVGTYMAWQVNNNNWWGEGEIKFFLDGDGEFPTICGTGTEDYFGGSYDFDVKLKNAAGVESVQYQEFTTPYSGLPQVIRGDGHYQCCQRFGLYRWHITDPIRFTKDLRVTMQDLGWRSDRRFLAQQSDISSVAFWYQTLPTAAFPQLPDRDYLEII